MDLLSVIKHFLIMEHPRPWSSGGYGAQVDGSKGCGRVKHMLPSLSSMSTPYTEVSDPDLDYHVVHVSTSAIGDGIFQRGVETVCLTKPQLRGGVGELRIKSEWRHIFIASGPGVFSQDTTPGQMGSRKGTTLSRRILSTPAKRS